MPSRRFEGAVTTPADGGVLSDQSIPPPPQRPARPILVELAAAILIVGGLTSLIGSLAAPGLLGIAFVALNVVMVVLGVLIRRARAWVVAVNVVVVALFLEVTALPSAFAIVFIILDAIVLAALISHRAWFDWRPEDVLGPEDAVDPDQAAGAVA